MQKLENAVARLTKNDDSTFIPCIDILLCIYPIVNLD